MATVIIPTPTRGTYITCADITNSFPKARAPCRVCGCAGWTFLPLPVATHHLTHHIVVTNDAEVQRPDCVGYVTRTGQLLRSTHCAVCTVSEVVIDISALGALISVGDNWFSDPTEAFARKRRQLHFVRMELTGLQSLSTIGRHFLSQLSFAKGETIDLVPLSNVTFVGECFLARVDRVTKIDLRPLRQLSSISMSFLRWCSLLTHVDLSEMHNVRAIDSLFLAHCRSLVTIDVTGLSQVTSVGGYFLGYCVALQTVVGLDSWINVTDVGKNFLSHCSAIASLDLSGIPPR